MRYAPPIARYLIILGAIALTFPIGWGLLTVGLDVWGIATLLSQSTLPNAGLACMLAASVAVFGPIIFLTAVVPLAE